MRISEVQIRREEGKSPLHMLFLDIEMDGIDGIATGQWIRRRIEYETTQHPAAVFNTCDRILVQGESKVFYINGILWGKCIAGGVYQFGFQSRIPLRGDY